MGLWWLWSWQVFLVNQDAQEAMRNLDRTMVRLLAQPVITDAYRDELRAQLDRLIEIVERDASVRVHLAEGAATRLAAKSELLFGRTPVLPAEEKVDGRWRFQEQRFAVTPRALYIYGLRFGGDHTIRIKRVTLFFRDGGSIIHNDWAALEDGNGRAFDKREMTPMLGVRPDGRPGRARALAAVSIEGSAQDRGFAAALRFELEVPALDANPHQDVIRELQALREAWRTLDRGMLTQSRGRLQILSLQMAHTP